MPPQSPDAAPAWTAHFVAASTPHTELGHPAPYFRTEFDVAAGLRAARLLVTGLGLIEAHLNGEVVGDEVLCPGWTSYRHRLVVSDHDVTGLVRQGRNALGAIAADGWAVGDLTWNRSRNHWSDRPAALLQLELTYADHVEVIATDDSWRTAPGAVLAADLYDGELVDARREPAGWDRPGFDDGSWAACEIVDWDRSSLELQATPPIRRIEELAPVSITPLATGERLVDFGQVFSGWVRLRLDGPAGSTVTIRHAELLVEGQPEYETNRSAKATDRYVLRGGGPEEYEPRFTFHGFRYAVIEGVTGEPRDGDVAGVVIHSDLPRIGWFECSDERLNRLHRNIVWSWRGNSVGVPTDCPQRDERLGWTGDINAFAPTAAFLFDTAGFLGSWLDDLVAEQAALGFVPVVVPDVLSGPGAPGLGGGGGPTALWGDVVVSLPWALYLADGDRDALARRYPAMRAFIDSVEEKLDERGLWSKGFQFGDWVDPDSPPTQPGRAKAEATLVATAYLHRTTGELAAAAEVLGYDDDAAVYRARQQRVREAFQREWVAPSGRMSNECQTSYALAICFGLLDPDQEARAAKRLVELVHDGQHRIATGFAGTPWVPHALSRHGYTEDVYRMLARQEPPSFTYPLTKDATTIWERWDAVLPDGTLNSTGMTSLNHYALGAIGDWMHQVIGGIRPIGAGYTTVEIAPVPGGGLSWASASHIAPQGRIAVAWRDGDGRRHISVEVPAGTTARVVLPDHPELLVAEVGPGEHRWDYAIPVADRFTVNTAMAGLRADTTLWSTLYQLFSTVMPGVPNLFDHIALASPDLAAVLEHLPGTSDELATSVREALAEASRR